MTVQQYFLKRSKVRIRSKTRTWKINRDVVESKLGSQSQHINFYPIACRVRLSMQEHNPRSILIGTAFTFRHNSRDLVNSSNLSKLCILDLKPHIISTNRIRGFPDDVTYYFGTMILLQFVFSEFALQFGVESHSSRQLLVCLFFFSFRIHGIAFLDTLA